MPAGEAPTWTSPLTVVAGFIVVGYTTFLIFVLTKLGTSDPTWTRLTLLYGTINSVLLAATGALFGTGIQQRQTRKAESQATAATTRADQASEEAARGRTLAAAVRVAHNATQGGGPAGPDPGEELLERGVPREVQPAGQPLLLSHLASLADELFPGG
jgi:hypothetical protein